MDNRKFQAAAAASPPAAEATPSSGYPTDGNPAGGVPATLPGAAWFNQIGEELREVIAGAGLTPSATDLTQLQQAIELIIAANAAAKGDNADITSLRALIYQVGNINLFVNGDMSIAQEFVSTGAAVTPSGASTYQVDQWSVWGSTSFSGGTIATAARVAGDTTNGYRYALQVLVSAGDTLGTLFLTQTLERAKVMAMAGKECTLRFRARKGSAYSGTLNPVVSTYSGTGATSQSQATGVGGGWTGHTPLAWTAAAANVNMTSLYQDYTFTTTLPGSITQLLYLISVGGAGAGGANNWMEITGLQIKIGKNAPFEFLSPQDNLAACQPFLEKSFDLETLPAHSAAITGAESGGQIVAASTSQHFSKVDYKVRKRAGGTIGVTIFSPAISGNAPYNTSTTSLCTSVTLQYNGESGFCISATTPSGSATGNLLAYHWLSRNQF